MGQFGMPDVGLICRLYTLFGLDPAHIAFAFDPGSSSVCCEYLFLDLSRIPQSLQLPGTIAYVTFWLMELARAVAHQGAGPSITEQILQVQTELVARLLPTALQFEMGWASG